MLVNIPYMEHMGMPLAVAITIPGVPLQYEEACERVYGEPYADWKKQNQKKASSSAFLGHNGAPHSSDPLFKSSPFFFKRNSSNGD